MPPGFERHLLHKAGGAGLHASCVAFKGNLRGASGGGEHFYLVVKTRPLEGLYFGVFFYTDALLLEKPQGDLWTPGRH